jgi:hypothetical protein
MSKDGAVRALAISVKMLRHNGDDGHGNTYEAVLVDTNPNYVEPRQPRFRRSPTTTIPTAALGKPVQGYNPRLYRLQLAKELLLLMKIRSHKVAHEGKERCNGKGLVRFADDLVVYSMPVKPKREEGRCRVYGYHKEDSDDAVTR